MSLDTIVNISISTQTTAPEQANFGTPLVAAYHTVWPERVRLYDAATGIADMILDGFLATDPAVVAATVVLSQNPKVTEIAIGRLTGAPLRAHKLTPILAGLEAGVPVDMVINGNAIQPVAASPTIAELTADMKTKIDALALTGVTTTDNSTDLDIDVTAGNEATVEVPRRQITRKDETLDPVAPQGSVADLVDITNEFNDWYSLVMAQESEAITLVVAAHIETLSKTYIAVTGDDDVLDAGLATDVASDLASGNYANSAIYYHPKPHTYPNAGHIGVELPKDPGSYTMKFKTLAGVETVTMTATEKNTCAAKRANTYTAVAGISIVEEGVVSAAGEFIDVTRFVHWFRARLQERIYTRFVNLDKVPMDDSGLGIAEAEIRGQQQDGIDVGGLAANPAPTVTVPKVANIPFINRAARQATGLRFDGSLAGAIHELNIQGVFTV